MVVVAEELQECIVETVRSQGRQCEPERGQQESRGRRPDEQDEQDRM